MSNVYQRQFTNRMNKNGTIDVYDVLVAFNVTCPMKAHAIKKLLVTGNRLGGKSKLQDLHEAIWSLNEALNEYGDPNDQE